MLKNGKLFLLFIFCAMLLPTMLKNTINNETNISRTRIRRGGLVNSGIKCVKWTMKGFRVRQAMDILLTDAKLIKVDTSLDIEWYQQQGALNGISNKESS